MSDSDKQALLDGTATIQTKLEVLVSDNIVESTLTEENSVIDWNYEDFRQVKDEGFIGQFVARQLTGNLKNLSDNFKITDKELILKLGVRTNNNTNWYSLGNFLVTKVKDDEVNDKTNFEALDYTKKFNKAYEDTITYPCTALQLAQNVCNQCGVTLETTNFRNYNYVITGNVFTNGESCRDVMKAIGKLAFSWVRVDWDNKVYIDFDPSPFKNLFDKDNVTLGYRLTTEGGGTPATDYYVSSYIKIEPNTIYTKNSPTADAYHRFCFYSSNTADSFVGRSESNTATSPSTAQYMRICGLQTELNTTTIKQQPSTYDKADNSKYYNLKTQKEVYGPVDKIIIGYSQIEGEKTYIGDEDGTCIIGVYDNPLVYTQEQRENIINSYSDFLGMTYTPLTTQTVGHPWLKGNEVFEVTDMENVAHKTLPLDRTIQYFGHIKTLIDSSTPTKTNDTLAYKPKVENSASRTEIIVDKLNKEVTTIVEEVIDEDNPNSLVNRVEEIQTSTYTKTEIQNIVDGTGVDGVKVTKVETISGTFDINGMHYEKSGAYTKSTINETGVVVEKTNQEDDTELLYAGYDENIKRTIVRTENLNTRKYLRIGNNSRVQDYKTGGGVFIA